MSFEKGNVILTYDVDSRHPQVRSALKAMGYYDRATIGNKKYNLPNTTMWRPDASTHRAIADLRKVCIENGVTLKTAVSVLGRDWELACNQE